MTDEMAAFARIVELGGFSAAGRDLGLTPSALSKALGRLEARLGVRLLNRTTRALTLTAEGETYFARSQRILADIRDAEAEVVRAKGRPRGLLRVTVGTAFGQHQLPRVVPAFLERYPDIRLELGITDRTVDLVKETTDLGLRTGALPDSRLVARKICDLQRVICAAPSYLARHGVPQTPDDLPAHNCICLKATATLNEWSFRAAKGARSGKRVIAVAGNVVANNAETVLQLGLAGAGIIRLGDNIVGEHLRQGKLIPMLTDSHWDEPLPVHAVYLQGRHRLPKVAAFLDFLVEQFAGTPWRAPQGKRVKK